MEKKQTAVQWLKQICDDRGYILMQDYFEQALQMEREQIEEAFVAGDERGTKGIPFNAEQYYTQTFKP